MKDKHEEIAIVGDAARKLLASCTFTQEEVDALTPEEEREWEEFINRGVIVETDGDQFSGSFWKIYRPPEDETGEPFSQWSCRRNALGAAKGLPGQFEMTNGTWKAYFPR